MQNEAESARTKGINSFALKMVAIIAMTANHSALILGEQMPFWLYCLCLSLGGITFPVMAYLLVEGYRYTSNLKKYAIRLGVFALVAQIPFWLFLGPSGNVLITLLFGLGILHLYDTLKNRLLFWMIFILSLIVGFFLDWGFLGIIMILLFYRLPDRVERAVIPVVVAILGLGLPALSLLLTTSDITYLPAVLYSFVGGFAAMGLLLVYNGQRGPSMKYFFYLYYPLHILVLGLVQKLFF